MKQKAIKIKSTVLFTYKRSETKLNQDDTDTTTMLTTTGRTTGMFQK
jgi:hypothetical protein